MIEHVLEALGTRPLLVALSLTLALGAATAPGAGVEPGGSKEDRGPAIGSEAAGFILEALDGREVSLADLTEEGPVVLVFFRGAW